MTQENSTLPIIGWREWLSIPDLNIPHIKAKVDTGARTSCLHTAGLELYTTDSGEDRVRFQVHPDQNSDLRVIDCDWPVDTHKSVRDSGGHEEIRPFIKIPVTLGEHTWEIQFSLTNRDNMKFRMLLGRRAMENRFLVDPVGSYLSSKRPKRRKVTS